jgi:hypothetical protein
MRSRRLQGVLRIGLVAIFATAVVSCDRAEGRSGAMLDPASEPAATSPPSSQDEPDDTPAPVEFAGDLEGEPLRLTLVTSRSGPISGALSGFDGAFFLTGTLEGGQLEGQLSGAGTRVPVRGEIKGDTLRLSLGPDEDGELLQAVLRRTGAREPVAPLAAFPSSGTVIVNGDVVDTPTRARLEQQYGLRMIEGRYWYDGASGAWGIEGGPTLGYLQPGMPLGGPLRADASGGGTGVLVNGRALHAHDLLSLQMLIGTVNPGRYVLDPHGNLGLEGGPPLVNLVARLQAFAAEQQAAQLHGPGWVGGGGNSVGGDGGDGGWYSGITGAGGSESGGSGYVMGEGWSVSY